MWVQFSSAPDLLCDCFPSHPLSALCIQIVYCLGQGVSEVWEYSASCYQVQISAEASNHYWNYLIWFVYKWHSAYHSKATRDFPSVTESQGCRIWNEKHAFYNVSYVLSSSICFYGKIHLSNHCKKQTNQPQVPFVFHLPYFLVKHPLGQGCNIPDTMVIGSCGIKDLD